jgi:hypothetical protein
MTRRHGWALALGMAAALGLAGTARAQNFGGFGGNFGGATITTQGFGLTGFGVPAAVSNGWGFPMGYGYGGYGGYGVPMGYGYSPFGYGYNPYLYGGGYGMPGSVGYSAFYPGNYTVPQMGNNLGGLMGVIQGNAGRGTWGR